MKMWGLASFWGSGKLGGSTIRLGALNKKKYWLHLIVLRSFRVTRLLQHLFKWVFRFRDPKSDAINHFLFLWKTVRRRYLSISSSESWDTQLYNKRTSQKKCFKRSCKKSRRRTSKRKQDRDHLLKEETIDKFENHNFWREMKVTFHSWIIFLCEGNQYTGREPRHKKAEIKTRVLIGHVPLW